MDFAATIRKLDSWSGKTVGAVIRGLDEGEPVLFFEGELQHVHESDYPVLPPEWAELIEYPGETFLVGTSQLELIPERFVESKPMPHALDHLEIRTQDVLLTIGPVPPRD